VAWFEAGDFRSHALAELADRLWNEVRVVRRAAPQAPEPQGVTATVLSDA
jgi:hypothetical protein